MRAVALGAAVAAWASLSADAAADEFVPRLGVQTGVTITRSPGNDSDDYFVAATPELGYFFGTERTQVGIIYSFTGSLNTFLPNGIANRLALTLAYDAGPRTRLLFGVEALQASLGNYLLVKRTTDTPIGGVPILSSQLGTLTATQGLSHELDSNLRLNQALTATYVRSLDLDVHLDNYLASTTVGVERGWTFDAVGVELNAQYARSIVPPLPNSRTMTVSLGPTWDHDFTRSLSGSASVAAAVAFSTDEGTEAQVAPAGRAALLYYVDGSGIELSYVGGFEPNTLLGTLTRSHQGTLRAYTPISDEHRILVAASSGILRAKTLDLRSMGALNNEVDSVLHDAELTWGVADYLNLFLRYQFIGQTAGSGIGVGATPALVRHSAIIGFDIFGGGRPTKPRVQTKFPQRVDRTDAPPADKRR